MSGRRILSGCTLVFSVCVIAGCAPSPRLAPRGADVVQYHAADAGLLRSAVSVGGPTDLSELATMTEALDAALAKLLAVPLPVEPAARGRAVLALLFSPPGGRPLLREYAPDATTLREIATTGRFNCVSATMLYILAARRVGLDARPVLLPSHARALVVIGERGLVVETTTANGFDPPAWVSRETLDRARPRGTGPHVDLYADERGTEVEWNALLGIAYGNLSVLARARGESAVAAGFLERELALTPPAQAPLVKAQQASLLTELATRALKENRFDEALALAFRADEAAPDPRTKRLTGQNLTAIASQQLVAEGATMDDARLLAFAEPFRGTPSTYGDVRALALTSLGQRRLKRGDLEGSSAALREAAQVAATTEVKGQADQNARIAELNRLGSLSSTDPEAAWTQLAALGPPDPTVADLDSQVRQAIAENRAVRDANAGRCDALETALREGGSPRAAVLRASCHARHGISLADQGDVAHAIVELREAVRLDPAAPHHRKNLVIMIEKQIDHLAHNHGCNEVAPLMAEGRALEPNAPFFDQAAEYCRHSR